MTRAFLVALGVALAPLSGCQDPAPPWLTMPTPEEHAARSFPATPGTPHEECSCEDCHADFPTFRQFDCLHCHTGAHASEAEVTQLHADAAVQDFSWSSEACYRCHPDGAGVNHGPIFPISSGAHAGTSCRECHLSLTDRTVLACAGCHPHTRATADGDHLQVGGYAFDSRRCLACHADSQVDRLSAHTGFPIGSGTKHVADRADCLRCHPAWRADKPFGADFTVADCLGCHVRAETDGRHDDQPEYRYETPACLDCHPAGRAED